MRYAAGKPYFSFQIQHMSYFSFRPLLFSAFEATGFKAQNDSFYFTISVAIGTIITTCCSAALPML